MKLVDANVLLYAIDDSSPHHGPTRAWLDEQLSGRETFAMAWHVLLAFIRLSTSPVVYQAPLSGDEALDLIDAWLAQPCVTVVHPTGRHAAVLRELLAATGTAGNLTTDAHLAALSIEHGADLYSADRDFERFPGVRWRNPLSSR